MALELMSIDPIKVDDREGRRNFHYSFDKIHVEDITGEEFDDRVEIDWVKDRGYPGAFWYQFKDSPKLLVSERLIYMELGENELEASKRAYFMLDILDSHGKVSGWRRV